MLASDGSLPCEDLGEKFIQRFARFFLNCGIVWIFNHDVHMDISISRMAEASERKAVFFLEACRKF